MSLLVRFFVSLALVGYIALAHGDLSKALAAGPCPNQVANGVFSVSSCSGTPSEKLTITVLRTGFTPKSVGFFLNGTGVSYNAAASPAGGANYTVIVPANICVGPTLVSPPVYTYTLDVEYEYNNSSGGANLGWFTATCGQSVAAIKPTPSPTPKPTPTPQPTPTPNPAGTQPNCGSDGGMTLVYCSVSGSGQVVYLKQLNLSHSVYEAAMDYGTAGQSIYLPLARFNGNGLGSNVWTFNVPQSACGKGGQFGIRVLDSSLNPWTFAGALKVGC